MSSSECSPVCRVSPEKYCSHPVLSVTDTLGIINVDYFFILKL